MGETYEGTWEKKGERARAGEGLRRRPDELPLYKGNPVLQISNPHRLEVQVFGGEEGVREIKGGEGEETPNSGGRKSHRYLVGNRLPVAVQSIVCRVTVVGRVFRIAEKC